MTDQPEFNEACEGECPGCSQCRREQAIISRILGAVEYVEREFDLKRTESIGYMAIAQKLLMDLSVSLPQDYA